MSVRMRSGSTQSNLSPEEQLFNISGLPQPDVDQVLLLLASHDVDVNSTHGISSRTALHRAAKRGLVDLAKILLDNGANVDSRDLQMQTPLLDAAVCGKLEMCKLLLQHGATLDATKKNGSTPLFRAVSNGHVSTAKFLVTCGADFTHSRLINVQISPESTKIDFFEVFFPCLCSSQPQVDLSKKHVNPNLLGQRRTWAMYFSRIWRYSAFQLGKLVCRSRLNDDMPTSEVKTTNCLKEMTKLMPEVAELALTKLIELVDSEVWGFDGGISESPPSCTSDSWREERKQEDLLQQIAKDAEVTVKEPDVSELIPTSEELESKDHDGAVELVSNRPLSINLKQLNPAETVSPDSAVDIGSPIVEKVEVDDEETQEKSNYVIFCACCIFIWHTIDNFLRGIFTRDEEGVFVSLKWLRTAGDQVSPADDEVSKMQDKWRLRQNVRSFLSSSSKQANSRWTCGDLYKLTYKSFDEELLEMIVNSQNKRLIAHPLIQTWVEWRWKHHIGWFFLHIFQFCSFLAFITLSSYYHHFYFNFTADDYKNVFWTFDAPSWLYFIDAGSFILWMTLILREVIEVFRGGIEYMLDVWNFLDLVILLLTFIASAQIVSGETSTKALVSLLQLCMWFKLLYYARGFRLTGPTVIMIGAMAKDIFRIVWVLCLIIVAYSQALAYMVKRGDTSFGSIGGSTKSIFSTLFSQFDLQELEEYPLATILLALFLFTGNILIINLIIATMSNTIGQINIEVESRYMLQKASMVLQMYRTLSKEEKIIQTPLHSLVLYVLRRPVEENLTPIDKCTKKLATVETRLQRLENSFQVSSVTIERRLERLSNFIERGRDSNLFSRGLMRGLRKTGNNSTMKSEAGNRKRGDDDDEPFDPKLFRRTVDISSGKIGTLAGGLHHKTKSSAFAGYQFAWKSDTTRLRARLSNNRQPPSKSVDESKKEKTVKFRDSK